MDRALEVQQWLIEHIQEGIRQAEAGEFATEAEVQAAFNRWQKRSSTGLGWPLKRPSSSPKAGSWGCH
jgi:predicted transcriptional regulator